nr:DOMON domain-containing protein [Thermococcus sp. MV5]
MEGASWGVYSPQAGSRGHYSLSSRKGSCKQQGDEQLGGSNDILEFGGREENGYTVIEFKRKLNTGDKYDKTLTPGQKVRFIFALADVDEFTTKHNIARGYGELTLD